MEAGPRGDPGVHVHGPAEEEYSFHTVSAPTRASEPEEVLPGSESQVPVVPHPEECPRTVMARTAAAATAAHPWRRVVSWAQSFWGADRNGVSRHHTSGSLQCPLGRLSLCRESLAKSKRETAPRFWRCGHGRTSLPTSLSALELGEGSGEGLCRGLESTVILLLEESNPWSVCRTMEALSKAIVRATSRVIPAHVQPRAEEGF